MPFQSASQELVVHTRVLPHKRDWAARSARTKLRRVLGCQSRPIFTTTGRGWGAANGALNGPNVALLLFQRLFQPCMAAAADEPWLVRKICGLGNPSWAAGVPLLDKGADCTAATPPRILASS